MITRALRASMHQWQVAANRTAGGDATRTVTLRAKYQADLRDRLRTIKRLIWEAVVTNDVFGLTGRVFLQAPRRFEFAMRPDKHEAFMEWLRGEVDKEVLEVTRGPRGQIVTNTKWQDVYVRDAYGRAIRQADSKLRAGGYSVPTEALNATFRQPIHAEKLNLLYSRNFTELRGVTDEMDKQISRVLSEGLGRGRNPRDIAREMQKTVDGISRTRADTLAQTEIIRAHAEGTLNRFEQAGAKGVVGQAEFATSGDDRVCSICAGLNGRRYTIAEARGIIPVHPRCRCTWWPVTRLTDRRGPLRPRTPQDPFEGFVEGARKARGEFNKLEYTEFQFRAHLGFEGNRHYYATSAYQDGIYGGLNRWLRGDPQYTAESVKWFGGKKNGHELVTVLDEAIAMQPATRQGTVVWRGGRDFGAEVGDAVVDLGYVSTSTSRTVASRSFLTGGRVLYRIGIPPGKKGIWYERVLGDGTEAEFLLPRGSKFRVIRKYTEKGQQIVDLMLE